VVDFSLSDEQRMLRDLARGFARDVVRPLANRHYRRGEAIPKDALDEVVRRANALHLADFYLPADLGGLGASDPLLACLVAEELSWGDAGIAVHVTGSSLALKAVEQLGSPEQRRRWLAPRVAAFALTEPGAGSHVTGISTRARRDGSDWILDGAKQFITNGGIADLYVVVAQDGDGLAAFLVEKGARGLRPGPEIPKWGVLASSTTEVVLDGVRVPAAQRLERGGLGGLLGVLEASRITIAAGAIGIGRAALEASAAYARTRVQKVPILEHQAVGHKLADLEMRLDAARLSTWRAAWMLGRGEPLARGEASQAKVLAGDVAVQCGLDAVQVHGGYGYTKEYDVCRWLLDALVYRIWEGTSEVLRNDVARRLAEGATHG
jgi:acyl-CoA dehydrogenase